MDYSLTAIPPYEVLNIYEYNLVTQNVPFSPGIFPYYCRKFLNVHFKLLISNMVMFNAIHYFLIPRYEKNGMFYR